MKNSNTKLQLKPLQKPEGDFENDFNIVYSPERLTKFIRIEIYKYLNPKIMLTVIRRLNKKESQAINESCVLTNKPVNIRF